MTQDGGGSGTSNNWINISAGLDGKPVEEIVTDPIRGSHDAYAVTTDGVFYMANRFLVANVPTWVNITGTGADNLNLAYSIFGQSYNPTTDGNTVTLNQAVTLSAIVADWRYQIPIDPTNPAEGHPPGALRRLGRLRSTGSGVYQSLDNGTTWTLFPSTTYGAIANGGDLPHAPVTDLDVSLGNVNANTGMPLLAGPLQAIVFTGTLTSGSATVTGVSRSPGSGRTAIPSPAPASPRERQSCRSTRRPRASRSRRRDTARSEPRLSPPLTRRPPRILISFWPRPRAAASSLSTWPPLFVGNTVSVDARPHQASRASPPFVGTPITISGTSEITDFGNTTWITVEDVTNPANPIVIAGYNPADPVPVPSFEQLDRTPRRSFSFNWDPGKLYTTDGLKTIEVFATDDAGAVGNKVLYTFNWDPATQLKFAATGEPPATAPAGANFASASTGRRRRRRRVRQHRHHLQRPGDDLAREWRHRLDRARSPSTRSRASRPSRPSDRNRRHLQSPGSSPGLATTMPPSTPIVIVGAATQLYIISNRPAP